MRVERLALFTTVYPAVLPYLRDWYRSVCAQTDREFDLWIAADAVAASDVASACGAMPVATWVPSAEGDTPAALRSLAMSRMVARHAGVIFVDSDDILEPTRVAAARESLRRHDVTACALRLVNDSAEDMGVLLAPDGVDAVENLSEWNVFGLSNTAYRSDVLARCLPVPPTTTLVDWYLATVAWMEGARMVFEPTPHMRYRQHLANVARVLPPFTEPYLRQATELVIRHHDAVAATMMVPAPIRAPMERASARVRRFRDWTLGSPGALARYLTALHRLPVVHAWWWCVAHPELEAMWSSS